MNKIIVSIALALILVLGINKITDSIYYVEKPEKSAYQIDGMTTVASDAATEASFSDSESENILAIFASTNATEGAKIFKKCAACHSISQGGGNKIERHLPFRFATGMLMANIRPACIHAGNPKCWELKSVLKSWLF